MSLLVAHTPSAPGRTQARPRRRGARRATSLFAGGEPWVWLTGGALAIAMLMILGLLALVLYQGGSTFWPRPVVLLQTHAGRAIAGEVSARDRFHPAPAAFESLPPERVAAAQEDVARAGGASARRLVRVGNYELSGSHFEWVSDFEVARESRPEWMLVIERLSWGRFYGEPVAFLSDGEVQASRPGDVWGLFERHHGEARDLWSERRHLETHAMGRVHRRVEDARLDLRKVELREGTGSPAWRAAQERFERVEREADEARDRLLEQIQELDREGERHQLRLRTAQGQETTLPLAQIVRAFPPNQLGPLDKLGVYAARTWEFLADEPREANSEGGVFPAIFGTVVMTLIMTLLVVPFGVLAALYLREYAKPGPVVTIVRIAVNNLAGVPSIVFGVFGLGFFCYILGTGIDGLLFESRLPNPTYGKGGLLWASLTLALLTLPVVIVPSEEALSSVPGSMREGSYACGATKWQTIRRIVLPRALPGIMTGAILALARGAGEVAPLMLVGAVKLAPELPIDGVAPFVHPERSFMHLGFHIYDLGFQSQNSEAAKPMVYTTTLLLIAVVVVLNLLAITIRSRLRRRFQGSQVA